MTADCQKFVLHIQWAQKLLAPLKENDRNITQKKSKQYIYRQTQNTIMW